MSFNHTLSGNIHNAIRSPTPSKNKNKLVLRRYKSNFSLGRTTSNIPSAIHNLGETVSQSSSAASLGFPLNSNLGKTGEAITGRLDACWVFLVPHSGKNSPSRSRQQPPFHYQLPPKRPSILAPTHKRNKTSFISNKSSAKWYTEDVKENIKSYKTISRKDSSFVSIFNQR